MWPFQLCCFASPPPSIPRYSPTNSSICIPAKASANFEFLFDTSESREHGHDDPESVHIDKLRKDLVYMWRLRLYSDVRIALTGNFGFSHQSSTAIFSSRRFILVSRCSYFHTALIGCPHTKSTKNEPPTLTLPSPPFTPASLHFTLGFICTGTLVFSHRSYDLSPHSHSCAPHCI